MDGFSRYNQIKMHPDDEKHTVFRMPLGTYCYTIMLFGLKNVGATYQLPMSIIIKEHLHKIIECYVDYFAIKSKSKENHLQDLDTVFNLMRKHQLKIIQPNHFWGVL